MSIRKPTLVERFGGSPLDVVAQRWFDQLLADGRKPKTTRIYRMDLFFYLNWCEQNGYPTDTLSEETINAFIADYSRRPVKPASVNLRRTGMLQLLRFMRNEPQQRIRVSIAQLDALRATLEGLLT